MIERRGGLLPALGHLKRSLTFIIPYGYSFQTHALRSDDFVRSFLHRQRSQATISCPAHLHDELNRPRGGGPPQSGPPPIAGSGNKMTVCRLPARIPGPRDFASYSSCAPATTESKARRQRRSRSREFQGMMWARFAAARPSSQDQLVVSEAVVGTSHAARGRNGLAASRHRESKGFMDKIDSVSYYDSGGRRGAAEAKDTV